MPYRIKPKDDSITHAARRVITEQLDRAIAEIDATEGPKPKLDRPTAIHQVRKRCKKARAVLRLVKHAYADYARDKDHLRDTAAALGGLRDATANLEAYDRLMDHFQDQIDRPAFAPIRAWLTRERTALAQTVDTEDLLAQARKNLDKARTRAANMHLSKQGFDALEPGLTQYYDRGRDAIRSPADQPDAEDLHDWRKRAKDHWYHARLLTGLWPAAMGAHHDTADDLGELLGDDRDLILLRDRLTEGDPPIDAKTADAFLALLDRRRAEYLEAMQPLAALIYAEKTANLAARWRAYWHASGFTAA